MLFVDDDTDDVNDVNNTDNIDRVVVGLDFEQKFLLNPWV
jgi:uncharacterized protein related to proFAR isomerase